MSKLNRLLPQGKPPRAGDVNEAIIEHPSNSKVVPEIIETVTLVNNPSIPPEQPIINQDSEVAEQIKLPEHEPPQLPDINPILTDDLLTEEIIFKVVLALSNNEILLNKLVIGISTKLISETNRNDLLNFVSNHSNSNDQIKLLALQNEINKYLLFINNSISQIINKSSIQLVTKLYSENN